MSPVEESRESRPADNGTASEISTATKIETSVTAEVTPCAVFLDGRGMVRLLVICPHCGGLHRHPATTEPSIVVTPSCHGGRYRILWDATVVTNPSIRVVPCRYEAGELCVSCGDDADALYATRTITLAEAVS